MRGADEDLEIVTLLLANLALALDNLKDLDNLEDHDNLELTLDTEIQLGSLFKQFGSSLRKLQVAPSGDRTHVIASWIPGLSLTGEVFTMEPHKFMLSLIHPIAFSL